MTRDDSRLDAYLESIEKHARSARVLSIALTIVPVVAAALFLLITVRQVQTKQAEVQMKEVKLAEKESELEQRDRDILEREKRLEVLDKTVQQLPQPTFEAALNKTKYNPRIVDTAPDTNQYIRKIEVTRISAKRLEVNVKYIYTGSEGAPTVVVVASAFQSNGRQVPGTSYGAAVVRSGERAATVSIAKTQNSESYSSSTLKVCMQVAGGNTIGCKSMDYTMEWK